MSPRKSPSSARKAFQCEAVSFTPKRTQQPPRAWERRPATPFVARDEKQKIWKRVPLGELGVDANRPSGLSRRVQEGTKDYVRIVKKLKVGHGEDTGEDKENSVVAVGSKLAQDDDYCDHLKKKKSVHFTKNSLETEAAKDDDISDSGIEIRNTFTEAETEMDHNQSNGNEVVDSPKGQKLETDTPDVSHEEPKSVEFESQAELRAPPETETQELPPQEKETAHYSEEDLGTSDDGAAHDQRSSSPPTILAENITVDELAAKQSMVVDPNEQATIASEQSSSIGQDGSRRTSDGEATFLRAFMNRAMSEKMAREKALEASSDSGEVQAQQEPPEDLEKQPDNVAQETGNQPEPNSPLRRSKRAVATSIPRLHAVPNAIQLKRANGTEFIFNANKPTSAINIVATTRANTKKNKGSALNVSTRLEQLTSQKAGEANELEEQAKAEPSTKISKKRKQEKGTEDSRVKKVLRWNDENLVAFREADPEMGEELDEIEDSSQENASVTQNSEDLSKPVKLKLTVASSTAQKADKENSRQSGLRRVRRGVAGTVNGTPAPKTRARNLEESYAVEEDEEVEHADAADVEETKPAATANTSKIPSSSRRSRMPVPAASRKAEVSTTRAKSASSNVTMQGKSEQQLGRRSLRVRQ